MGSKEEINSILNTILLNPTNELKLSQIRGDNKILTVAFGTGYLLKISAWVSLKLKQKNKLCCFLLQDYPRKPAKTWVSTNGKSKYITSYSKSTFSSITHQFMLVMYAYCIQSKIKFPEFIKELDLYFADILKGIVRSPTFQWPSKF